MPRVKVLCPTCSKPVELSEVESHGVQSGWCADCKVLVHATFENRESGRKVWDVHFEKSPPEKKKPKGVNWIVFLLVILLIFSLALLFGKLNGWLNPPE